MISLPLHPSTQAAVDRFIHRPSHALILSGPNGSGGLAIATETVKQILDIPAIDTNPYVRTIASADGKALGVQTVRELEHFFSLKVPRDAAYNRAVIIRDSELLGSEAQNALLKTLEEPPAGSLLILITSHERSLLPTIRSRAQSVSLQRPEQAIVVTYFSSKDFSEEAIKQAYLVSGGLPELMTAILEQADHPLLAATGQARTLLQQTTYERLCGVDKLAKDKTLADDTLGILQHMAHVSLQRADARSAHRWKQVLEASYQAQEALAQNGQPKLVLTNLMLAL